MQAQKRKIVIEYRLLFIFQDDSLRHFKAKWGRRQRVEHTVIFVAEACFVRLAVAEQRGKIQHQQLGALGLQGQLELKIIVKRALLRYGEIHAGNAGLLPQDHRGHPAVHRLLPKKSTSTVSAGSSLNAS